MFNPASCVFCDKLFTLPLGGVISAYGAVCNGCKKKALTETDSSHEIEADRPDPTQSYGFDDDWQDTMKSDSAFDRAWQLVKNDETDWFHFEQGEDDDYPDPTTWASEGRESDKCIGCGRPFAGLSPQEQSNSPIRCKTCEMVGDLLNPEGGGQDFIPPEQLSDMPYRHGKHPTHLEEDLIGGQVYEGARGQTKCSQRFFDQERFPEIYDDHVQGIQEGDPKCTVPWGDHCPCCGKIPFSYAEQEQWDDWLIEANRQDGHLCDDFDEAKYAYEQGWDY